MTKDEIRKLYKDKRVALSADEIEKRSRKISNKFFEHFFDQNQLTHIFLSIKKFKEFNSDYIVRALFEKNARVVTSVMHYQPFQLGHSIISPKTVYFEDQFGIPTPNKEHIIPVNENEIDVILVPLLAIDYKGNRIGYGKGIYDRFLSKCRPNSMKIGVSLFEPTNYSFATNEYDIPLDHCITPQTIHHFNGLR